MKIREKRTSLPIFALLFTSVFILIGCVSSKDTFLEDKMAQGVRPLSAAELKKTLSDSTVYIKHPTKYEGNFFYAGDGSMEGRVWWKGGEQKNVGKWYIKDEGLMCEKWLNNWGKNPPRAETCYSFYPGDSDNQFTQVLISGPSSKNWPDGLVPLVITKGKK